MKSTEIRIPWSTFLKLAAFAFLVFAFLQLWPLLLLLMLAALIAVSIDPWIMRLQRYLPRWLALGLLALVLLGGTLFAGYCIFPPVVDQATNILEKAPGFVHAQLDRLPDNSVFRASGGRVLDGLHFQKSDIDSWVPRLLVAGQVAMGGLASALLLFVLTFYLLIDGKRTLEWLITFYHAPVRARLRQTCNELQPMISAYMVGQLVTSLLAAVFVYGLLKILGVPAAMTLGLLAGVLDILPVIGFISGALPAVAFAFTVSPTAALITFFAFGTYHLFEAYVICPFVYGNRLQLSGLSVLLALLIGATLGGIVGAIVVMPLVAAYPIVERLWLSSWLGRDVIANHASTSE